jgi:hypothetical protein
MAGSESHHECPKCKGHLTLEKFSDDFFLLHYAWGCLNCGAIIDSTIATNRRKSLANQLASRFVYGLTGSA